MTDYEIARSTVEKLAGHLSAVAAGTARRGDDPAAERLRVLVPGVVRPALWQPFEDDPGDPSRRAALADGLAAAMAADPALVRRVQAASQRPDGTGPAFAPIGEPVAAPPPVRWTARETARRNPYVVMGAIAAAFVLLAGVVLGTNALLGSGDEDDVEATVRDFAIAVSILDGPTVCGLITPEQRNPMLCGADGERTRLTSDDRFRDLVTDAMDITVDLQENGTATATCDIRLTPDTKRQLKELLDEVAGGDSGLGSQDPDESLSMRLGLRKDGDRWLVSSYRQTRLDTD
ncbi:hypothetical protein [Actinomadura algeriensis]|uniref:Mce-associated membrane protein n=1 Tax=Actinomadura algeriensis TaxID=1679523 RepID=A0ABR9JPU8_9ACTN|nr:hypothetical protein [Actinomadura algeriensis]MBE1532600.1 hypothetical protein [Actinomadura algeriensis]